MALRFPFRSVSIPQPAATLGGQLFRLRPLADLTVIGPAGTVVREALFDTGADEVVLREADAARLGINLTSAPMNTLGGVGSPPHVVRYARVRLRLTDGIESREWSALVGFTTLPLSRILFGQTGGLQFFTAVFHGDQSAVELTVNSLYPGT
jgi:predicted aspartyl protease